MTPSGKRGHATLGFTVHTGWAAMIAVTGSPKAPSIVDRRRVEMIAGTTREQPRFVYHAARELDLAAADRLVRAATKQSETQATAALETAIADLAEKHCDVTASGILVGAHPVGATLENILKNHSLVHAAEGELFRAAIKRACEGLKIPVTEIRARELQARAAKLLGLSADELPDCLAAIGRAAGKPWAKDQKDSLLVALLAAAG